MIPNTIQRLITVCALTIIIAQLVHAQSFPWQAQAQLAADPGGPISFTKIDAPDTLHAMALGFGGSNIVVCRTTDGGNTWDQPLQRWFLETAMHDLSHPTPQVAVIVGDTMYRDTGNTIIYTHNNGNTWQQGWCDSCRLPDGSRYHLWHVSMCDSSNGILSAFLSCLARTTDGGTTWHRIPDPTNGQELFYGLQCLTPSTYILTASAYLSGIVHTYQTTDNGKTWNTNLVARWAGTPTFIDPLNGWAVGTKTIDSEHFANIIVRTTDGGSTWDTLVSALPTNIHEQGITHVAMADSKHGIANGDGGGWYYTTDGTTWHAGKNVDSVFKYQIFSITSTTYPHPDKAWAVDVLGHILVYRPRTATIPIIPGVTVPTSIEAYPNPITSGAPVTLLVNLPHTDHARLSLLDVRGSTVATIDQPITGPGTFRVTWLTPASLPAGSYFLRLVNGSTITTLPISVMH